MNILDKIISNKKAELVRQKEAVSQSVLEELIATQECVSHSFKQALANSSTGIISEFKRKSPSKGWIFEHASVSDVVKSYVEGGATALSVLTDEVYFGGSFEDFKTARSIAPIPLLRKDFMVDEYQLYQAKALGADVILLIAAALTPALCRELAARAKNLGLEVLLEIHNEKELEYIESNIDVVGINNRDLTTFVTDVEQSFRLGEKIPADYLKISESGIFDTDTVISLRKAGFRGFLIGENFMRTGRPGEALKEFCIKIENEYHPAYK